VTVVDHERYAQDVGAYLLGALPELEAQVFERHLMGCDECRDELERLRVAADALPRSVESFEPPPSLKRSLMEVVEAEARERAPRRTPARERRRHFALPALGGLRPRLAWAAAALVLLGGAIGFGADRLGRGGSSSSSSRVVTAQVDRGKLPRGSASLELNGRRESAALRVAGLPVLRDGRVYEVWVGRGGSVRPAGALFVVGRDGRGVATIPRGLRGVDQVMVTRERAGGAATPSELPVIRVKV
jgi:anti-sigma-K factor RskA